MSGEAVNNERIEVGYRDLEQLRRLAWSLPLPDAAALAERVQVEMMIDKKLKGSVKRFYRAYADYLEEVVEERMESEEHPRDSFQHHIFAYVRNILDPEGE
jgi:hypothetical protein